MVNRIEVANSDHLIKEDAAFFKEHELIVIDDMYSERGNFVLGHRPHETTHMTCNLEITYNSKMLFGGTTLKRLLQQLDITLFANDYYDRSDEVDKLQS